MRTKDEILKDADNVDDRSVPLVEVLVDIRGILNDLKVTIKK